MWKFLDIINPRHLWNTFFNTHDTTEPYVNPDDLMQLDTYHYGNRHLASASVTPTYELSLSMLSFVSFIILVYFTHLLITIFLDTKTGYQILKERNTTEQKHRIKWVRKSFYTALKKQLSTISPINLLHEFPFSNLFLNRKKYNTGFFDKSLFNIITNTMLLCFLIAIEQSTLNSDGIFALSLFASTFSMLDMLYYAEERTRIMLFSMSKNILTGVYRGICCKCNKKYGQQFIKPLPALYKASSIKFENLVHELPNDIKTFYYNYSSLVSLLTHNATDNESSITSHNSLTMTVANNRSGSFAKIEETVKLLQSNLNTLNNLLVGNSYKTNEKQIKTLIAGINTSINELNNTTNIWLDAEFIPLLLQSLSMAVNTERKQKDESNTQHDKEQVRFAHMLRNINFSINRLCYNTLSLSARNACLMNALMYSDIKTLEDIHFFENEFNERRVFNANKLNPLILNLLNKTLTRSTEADDQNIDESLKTLQNKLNSKHRIAAPFFYFIEEDDAARNNESKIEESKNEEEVEQQKSVGKCTPIKKKNKKCKRCCNFMMKNLFFLFTLFTIIINSLIFADMTSICIANGSMWVGLSNLYLPLSKNNTVTARRFLDEFVFNDEHIIIDRDEFIRQLANSDNNGHTGDQASNNGNDVNNKGIIVTTYNNQSSCIETSTDNTAQKDNNGNHYGNSKNRRYMDSEQQEIHSSDQDGKDWVRSYQKNNKFYTGNDSSCAQLSENEYTFTAKHGNKTTHATRGMLQNVTLNELYYHIHHRNSSYSAGTIDSIINLNITENGMLPNGLAVDSILADQQASSNRTDKVDCTLAMQTNNNTLAIQLQTTQQRNDTIWTNSLIARTQTVRDELISLLLDLQLSSNYTQTIQDHRNALTGNITQKESELTTDLVTVNTKRSQLKSAEDLLTNSTLLYNCFQSDQKKCKSHD